MANNKNSGRDIYPQFLRGLVTETAVNTYTQGEINTPVPTNLPNGKKLVMNILKAFTNWQPHTDLDSGDVLSIMINDRPSTAMMLMSQPGVLVYDEQRFMISGASGARQVRLLKVYDFTDGAGHGVLYARSKIYLAIQGASLGAAQALNVALLYTLVPITSDEYIGLVEGA